MHRFSHQRGPTPYLSTVERVQAHFGFTQEELADLLGVSRVVLSREGRAGRSLPLEALQRLHLLADAVAATPPPSEPPLALSDDERQGLDLRRRGLELQAYALNKQLARARTRLAQAGQRQQTLPGLRAAFPADDKLAQLAFDHFERQAGATLRTEPGPAALLTLRLAVLAFEVTEINRLLDDTKASGE